MRLRHALLSIPLFFVVTSMLFFHFVHAAISNPFGGRIVDSKALQVRLLEAANFKCVVPGKTITTVPAGSSPTEYFIPAWVRSKTNTSPTTGKQILGLYGQSKTTITCIFQGTPPATQTIQLPTVTMYGTSK